MQWIRVQPWLICNFRMRIWQPVGSDISRLVWTLKEYPSLGHYFFFGLRPTLFPFWGRLMGAENICVSLKTWTLCKTSKAVHAHLKVLKTSVIFNRYLDRQCRHSHRKVEQTTRLREPILSQLLAASARILFTHTISTRVFCGNSTQAGDMRKAIMLTRWAREDGCLQDHTGWGLNRLYGCHIVVGSLSCQYHVQTRPPSQHKYVLQAYTHFSLGAQSVMESLMRNPSRFEK